MVWFGEEQEVQVIVISIGRQLLLSDLDNTQRCGRRRLSGFGLGAVSSTAAEAGGDWLCGGLENAKQKSA